MSTFHIDAGEGKAVCGATNPEDGDGLTSWVPNVNCIDCLAIDRGDATPPKLTVVKLAPTFKLTITCDDEVLDTIVLDGMDLTKPNDRAHVGDLVQSAMGGWAVTDCAKLPTPPEKDELDSDQVSPAGTTRAYREWVGGTSGD